ncbi:flagellar filament capping protein FliD [Sinanaerobacter chloroacetimidivorans]|uniref:Flagellar hook-associated protein 2 n=1 Tax=Sinanaerobacter chloroacetimidivorans TaxID=2818044 RepID=A0A8J7W1L1_9FIRM|nr:flagellar filament capping protein FliD [Sinanaerobacter chloroacetimidivorans]MBR0597510.1 flagellar filament capping protein FliD [Sinanaerobacter chloroacetimidivorans]
MATVNSTSSSTLSSLSAKTGLGGLVSGMDIDELVENMTATSREKILKQQQSVQKLEWKQIGYRSVSSALKKFQSSYLDVLSSTNFRSASFFNTVAVTSSSTAVTASSTSSASTGTMTINSIKQLATYQTVKGPALISKGLTGSLATETAGTLTSADIQSLASSLDGKSLYVSLDGKTKVITFDMSSIDGTSTAGDLQQAFQATLDTAFGTYTNSSGETKSVITASIVNDQLTFSSPGSTATVYGIGDDTSVLNALGFSFAQSNKLSSHAMIGDLPLSTELASQDTYTFSINSVEFSVSKYDTLESVMSRINSSKAGVTISYSSITDQFTMTSKTSGSGDNIVINEDAGGLMHAFGLTGDDAAMTYGKNAILSVNGEEIVRSSNSITIDGVNIELNNTTDEAVTLTMKTDTTSLMNSIKKFVEDYNSMVDLINGLVKEKVYSDYAPLSDKQKDEMSETEITKWEEKAKSGLLRGDSILKGISSKMNLLMTGLTVNGTSLYSMGITSAGYTENGKLQIDEEKLKTALETKGTEIRELFASTNGISNQLNSIINDAIKTSGPQGTRGSLIEAAGMESTMSDTENNITEKIERTNKYITTLQTRLTNEESRLWKKFTAMETALQQLNTQSSILTQFSSGS